MKTYHGKKQCLYGFCVHVRWCVFGNYTVASRWHLQSNGLYSVVVANKAGSKQACCSQRSMRLCGICIRYKGAMVKIMVTHYDVCEKFCSPI